MQPEADVKKRWCPFARVLSILHIPGAESVVTDTPASFNRLPRLADEPEVTWPMGATCMGRACMVWVWDSPEYEARVDRGVAPRDGSGWEKVTNNIGDGFYWRRLNTRRKGCCSLMQKPEILKP